VIYLSFFLLLFISLTFGITTQNNFLLNLDEKVLNFFHSIQTKTLDIFFAIITWLGSLWILLPIFVALLIYLFNQGYKYLVYGVSIGFLGAIGTTYSIKYLLNRHRPELYESIGVLPFDPSYPSGHTTQVFISVFLISFILLELNILNKLIYIWALLMIASLVAISRMYLQVHFLSDVFAGVVVALFWIYVAIYFTRKGV
jgi:undecaprenyl-diphosphatase